MTVTTIATPSARCSFAALALLSFNPAAFAQTAAAPEPAAEDSEAGVRDIVVTARKRSENLQTVPLSIKAIDSAELERATVRSLADVASLSPGLTFRDFGNGLFSTPIIRGIGPLNTLADTGTVSVFLDGLYLANRSALDVQLLDLERIEVVKGPQSTLYGQSSFAGAINYITREPGDTFAAKLSATVGIDDLLEGVATVSGPLFADKLGAKFSVSGNDFDGTFDNLGTPGKNLQGYSSFNASGMVVFTPTEGVKISPRVYYSRHNTEQSAQFVLNNNCGMTAAGAPTFFCGRLPSRNPVDIIGGTFGARRRTTVAALPIEIDITDDVTLTSLTGYVLAKNSSFQNYYTPSAGVPLPVVDSAAPAGTPPTIRNFNAYYSLGDERDRTYSQELRLDLGLTDRLDLLIGGFYYRNKYSQQGTINIDISQLSPTQSLTGVAALFQTRQPFEQRPFSITDLFSRVLAAFGSVQWRPIDGLRLGAEVRSNHDRRTIVRIPAPPLAPTGSRQRTTFHSLTPRFTIDYQITPEALVYTSAAKGVLSGGFNAIFPTGQPGEAFFDEETNWTYELGAKTRFLDGRVQINAAFFLINRDDLQLRSRSVDPTFLPTIVRNVGSARSKGFEVDARFVVAEGVSIDASYAYVDARFRNGSRNLGNRAICGVGTSICNRDAAGEPDSSGLRLPLSNKHQASAALDVRQPLSGDWNVYGRGDVSYLSSGPLRDLRVGPIIPSRTLVNLRVGAEGRGFDVSMWAKNLFNKDYAVSGLFDGGVLFPGSRVIVNQGERRVMGITAIKNF